MQSKPLTSKQMHAAAMIGGGSSQAEAARGVGVSQKTMCFWAKNPIFSTQVRAYEDQTIAERLRSTVMPSLDLLAGQLEDANGFIAQNAARDLLNRAGVTGVQDKVETQVNIIFGGIEVGEAEEREDSSENPA